MRQQVTNIFDTPINPNNNQKVIPTEPEPLESIISTIENQLAIGMRYLDEESTVDREQQLISRYSQ